MAGNRWAKGPDDFAVRVDVDDVPGLFRRELVVEAGTRALILEGGRDDRGDLGPGTYTLQQSGLTGTQRASAILVDAGDVPLEFAFEGIHTADPMRARVELRAVVTVESAALLATTLLRGAPRYTVADLRRLLYDEVEDAVREFIGRHVAADLKETLARKDDLAHHIAMHAEGTLGRAGLRLVAVEALRIHVDDAHELTADAVAAERKAVALNRLRRAALAAREDELANEAAIEELLRKHDRGRVLGEAEHDKLLQDIRNAKADAELNRQLAVKRIEMVQKFELDKLGLEQDAELLALERRKRELTLQMELDEERLAAAHRAETRLKLRHLDLAMRLAEAESEAEIAAIKVEQRRLKLEQLFWAKREMTNLKIERMREEERLQIEMEERRLQIELARKRAEQEIEAARIASLADAGPDALLAVSGTEQAALIADLRKTEVLRSMTHEQILAMAAADSPVIAEAFHELFRGRATDGAIDEASQRTADAERRAREAMEKQHAETVAILERFMHKSQDTQRDIAVAAVSERARGPEPPKTSGRCPNGHRPRSPDDRYCADCSEELLRD